MGRQPEDGDGALSSSDPRRRPRQIAARVFILFVIGVLLTVITTIGSAALAVRFERELSRVHQVDPDITRYTPEDESCYWTTEVRRRSWGWREHSVIQEPEVSRSGFERYVSAEFIQAGWPLRCAKGERWTIETKRGGQTKWILDGAIAFYVPSESSPVVLPFLPLWTGLLINSLLYAAAAWAMWRLAIAMRGFLRVRRNRCPRCSYPIGQSPVCTECGVDLPRT